MNKKPVRYYYIAYRHKEGVSKLIIETTLDLDTVNGITQWMDDEMNRSDREVVPVFWKQLRGDSDED